MKKEKDLLPLHKLFIAAGLPGILLFTWSILIFAVTRRREYNAYDVVDDSAYIQIIFTFGVFVLLVYMLFSEQQKRKFFFSSPQIYLFLYTIVCLLSMLWAPNVFMTGFRAFESLTYLLLVSLVAYNLVVNVSVEEIIEWGILWIIWDIIWSIAVKVKLSGYDVLLWPFEASRLTVPIFFFFALMLTQRKLFKYIILLFAILSVSNKVFFGIALGMLGFFWGDSRYKGWLFLAILAISVTLIFVNLDELLRNTLFYGRESVSLSNTSGRDKIWKIAWEAFQQKPFLGYGYVSGENAVLYTKFNGAINAHSSIFSGLLGTGIAGTIFLILYFGSAFKKAGSRYFPSHKWRPAMVSTVIMCIVVSLTAPGIGSRVYGSWLPVVLVFTFISALEYKFNIIYHVYNTQRNTYDENYLGNPFISRLSHSGL